MAKPEPEQQGFTLVETIIYVAIIGVVISSFVAFGISISSSRSKTYVVQEVQSNSRVAVSLLSRMIRQADRIVSPLSGDSSSSLVLEENGVNTLIGISNGVLSITPEAGDSVPITSDEVNIYDLLFINMAADHDRDNIGFSFTVEYTNPESIEFFHSQDIRTAVSTRK